MLEGDNTTGVANLKGQLDPPAGGQSASYPPGRTEVLDAWGKWLGGLAEWQWFVTMTFRDPRPSSGHWTRPGWAYANRAWQDFCSFTRPAVGALVWVRAFEMQMDRGVPHIHALVGGLDSVRWLDASAYLWKRYGFNRILEYDPKLGACHYICKYVVKELGDFAFSDSLHAQ